MPSGCRTTVQLPPRANFDCLLPFVAIPTSPQARRPLLRRIRHPQEKCLGNAPPSELVLCGVLMLCVQGSEEPQQDVSILYSSRSTVVEGCTVLIIAVPHYHPNDDITVTRSPVGLLSPLVSMPS